MTGRTQSGPSGLAFLQFSPGWLLDFCFFGLWGEREHATPAGFGVRDVELAQQQCD